MTAALIIGYIAVAVVAFISAMYWARDAFRYDDSIESGFACFGIFAFSAMWPLTIAMFLVVGFFWVLARLMVRVMP